MPDHKYFDLVSGALPRDFDPQELKEYGKAEWWTNNQFLASAYALRKCTRINWDAYLERNPDVRQAGVDPVLHFLRDGLFEGRRLYVYAKAQRTSKGSPKVSIVIPNYNNGSFLEHSLATLKAQTLDDIEIICVDDASTDNSVEIMRRIAASDVRFKVIVQQENQGQHIARITGVAKATGEYIMFMDADDHYSHTACEIAYAHARKGFDIVTFGANLILMPNADQKAANETLVYLNRGQQKVYTGNEILSALFARHAPSKTLWNKIYKSELAKEAFLEMECIQLYGPEDIYEIAVLASKARRMLKINERLYFYRFGHGCTTIENRAIRTKTSLDATMVAAPLKAFTQKSGIAKYYESLMGNIYKQASISFISHVDNKDVTTYFNQVADNLGVVNFITRLVSLVGKDVQKIAEKFKFYEVTKKCSKTKSIGILWSYLSIGGTQNVIKTLAPELVNSGYKVTVFLQEPYEYDYQLPENVNVVYYGSQNTRMLLNGLQTALIKNRVDVMLYQANYQHTLIQQIMMLKYMGVKVICFLHEAFFHKLLSIKGFYDLESFASVMRCADKVSVLSRYEAVYYHNLEVDAVFIPNAVHNVLAPELPLNNFWQKRKNIVVLGRISDPTKRILDCLHILKEISKSHPWVRMTFIGEFNDANLRSTFSSLASSLGIISNIRVTGWLVDPTPILDEACVMVSTAWHEAFPLSVSEAQARGLPVVMYDLPIQQALDNPSIIRVAHGDTYTAAQQVIAIIDSPEKWHELSRQARQAMLQFSPERYGHRVRRLMETFESESSIIPFAATDYEVIMRTLAFYGTQIPPWER